MNQIETKKGFTLIELLVVVAIIGVLSSVVLTTVAEARNKALAVTAKQEANALRDAYVAYEAKTGHLPTYINPWNISNWPSAAGSANTVFASDSQEMIDEGIISEIFDTSHLTTGVVNTPFYYAFKDSVGRACGDIPTNTLKYLVGFYSSIDLSDYFLPLVNTSTGQQYGGQGGTIWCAFVPVE